MPDERGNQTPAGGDPHGRTPQHRPPYDPRAAAIADRLEEEERGIHTNRILTGISLGLAILLAAAVAALIVGVIALNRDVDSVARAEPKANSVGPDSLQDEAVTTPKIAPGAVTSDRLAPEAVVAGTIAAGAVGNTALAARAVGSGKIADGAVTDVKIADGAVTDVKIADGAVAGEKVLPDSLTGDQIDESTLATVPAAELADDAAALNGLEAAAFLSGIQVTDTQSELNAQPIKALTANCPDGTRVVGGGAVIDGPGGVALTASNPAGATAWAASAEAIVPAGPWRLIVTAVCVTGGS